MLINKKAAIFHWIILGFIASVGIFFLLTTEVDTNVKVKGEWQLDFIEDYVTEAENKLLVYEIEAQNVALMATLDLAENGGYSPTENSLCGTYNNYQLWNKESTLCFPNIEESINETFSTYFELSGFTLTFEGEEFIGKSEESLEISVTGELQDKILEDYSDEEISCLDTLKYVPLYDLDEEFTFCHECEGDESCTRYINQFYCDLNPCNLNCVSFYDKNDVYLECNDCPEEESCDKYINSYYCTLDPCNHGCKWNVNVCENTDGAEQAKPWEDNIFEKMAIVSNPDVLSTKTKYEVPIAFRTDINYKFSEYDTLQADALLLLNLCKDIQDLEDCIEKNRKDYWKFTDCDTDNFRESERRVKFCVNSFNDAQLYFLDGTLTPVQYHLALDFYPSKALPVEELDVDYEGTIDAYLIYFNGDDLAEKYNLYVTDYYNAESYSGSVKDLENYYLLNSNTFDMIELDITNLEESCPVTKDLSQFYYCPTNSYEYIYTLPAEKYSEDDHFFTVTVEYNNLESEVAEFIQLN